MAIDKKKIILVVGASVSVVAGYIWWKHFYKKSWYRKWCYVYCKTIIIFALELLMEKRCLYKT
jgi:hypothetical protein